MSVDETLVCDHYITVSVQAIGDTRWLQLFQSPEEILVKQVILMKGTGTV